MRKKSILQVKGQNIELGQTTWIMGVLNVTPDSFSDGGLYFDKNKAIARGLEMALEGADILDVGGESTRPGSDSITTEEELKRVIPVIKELKKKTQALISIDTQKSELAQAALDTGADIINDISAFRFDSEMLSVAAQNDVPVIIMHMKGNPKTMQINPSYEDVLNEVKIFLEERIATAVKSGIKKEKIIIDPGIGFGKRLEDNLILINNIHFLNRLNRPILMGVSRKSFIGKILNLPPEERTEGTLAASVISILNGAHILRVHDVISTKRAILVAESIMDKKVGKDLFENQEEKKRVYVH